MDDRTFDLTDKQLAAAADEGWRNPRGYSEGHQYDFRRHASLRAVAALARQGWAPVGTGPSLEDLGPLIAWLGEAAMQAADAGRSDDAGKLAWALQIVGERVDEDAPDHVASVSNMVKSAPDTVYSRALQPNTMQLMKTSDDILPGPLSEHELREQWNQQADEHNQWESLESEEQLAWAQVRAIAMYRKAALLAESDAGDETGRILRLAEIIRDVDGNHDKGAAALAESILSHPGIRSVGLNAEPVATDGEVAELVTLLNAEASEDLVSNHLLWMSATEVRRAAELLQQRHPAPVAVSERPWERQPGWLDSEGECWWCPPKVPAYWQMANPAMVYGGWILPAHAIPLPAGEGE